MSSLCFEADICPETGAPRVRFNFSNGWSCSLVLHSSSANGCEFLMASVARCPTGNWGAGKAEILCNEARSDEAAHWLAGTAMLAEPS